jgi:translation initiation factor IF-2
LLHPRAPHRTWLRQARAVAERGERRAPQGSPPRPQAPEHNAPAVIRHHAPPQPSPKLPPRSAPEPLHPLSAHYHPPDPSTPATQPLTAPSHSATCKRSFQVHPTSRLTPAPPQASLMILAAYRNFPFLVPAIEGGPNAWRSSRAPHRGPFGAPGGRPAGPGGPGQAQGARCGTQGGSGPVQMRSRSELPIRCGGSPGPQGLQGD